jgi:hypothetical protein
LDKTNAEIDKSYYQYTQGEGQPKVKLQPKDNFENRAMVHLIAKSFVVVGYLEKSDLSVLYKAYPELKQIFRHCNRYFFDLGRKQVEKRIWEGYHE